MRLVVGVGCREATEAAVLREHAESVLTDAGWSREDVDLLVTVAGREHHPAVRSLAEAWGVDVVGYPRERLATQDVPTPSPRVAAASGTPSVAEAAVLAADAILRLPKQTTPMTSVAVGELMTGAA
ncbi:MAG: cobalamin biosynthesis protein [Mobilicoccus sp.]|nr:cobalamin biosynthesis protein [Mobilicoccus sp.]